MTNAEMTRCDRLVGAFFLTLALQNCAPATERIAPILTPSQVNALAAQYDGKVIQVRGYFVLTPEGQNIYESQSKFMKFSMEVRNANPEFDPKAWSKYCLTIANPGILTNNLASFSNKTLVIQGTFISNYFESHRYDLAACPLPAAILIDEVDLKLRYPGLVR